MIIWINGTFGAGKTTTAELVASRSERLRAFDPEAVGFMLRAHLDDFPVADFRDWSPWRVLTPIVADEVARFSGQGLVAAQTVLEEEYWDELLLGLRQRGHEVVHVLLEADEAVMRRRIEADAALAVARRGRLAHLPVYADARGWMTRRADVVVDSSRLTAQQTADRVWAATKHLVG